MRFRFTLGDVVRAFLRYIKTKVALISMGVYLGISIVIFILQFINHDFSSAMDATKHFGYIVFMIFYGVSMVFFITNNIEYRSTYYGRTQSGERVVVESDEYNEVDPDLGTDSFIYGWFLGAVFLLYMIFMMTVNGISGNENLFQFIYFKTSFQNLNYVLNGILIAILLGIPYLILQKFRANEAWKENLFSVAWAIPVAFAVTQLPLWIPMLFS